MNPEGITELCRHCPNLEPYVLDINRIRAKMIELIALQASGGEPEHFFVEMNALSSDLRESQLALDEAHARTVGCPGNKDNTCQSPLESNEIPDDYF